MKKIQLNQRSIRPFLYLLVAIVLAVVLIPQRSQLVLGIKTILHAEISWALIAVGCLLLAYLITASMYKILSKKKLNIFTTFVVQIATSFTNRVIPAGLGGLGLNADYLVKSGHNGVEAGSIVGVNSFIAFISHLSLIVIALIIGGVDFKELITNRNLPVWVPVVVTIVVLIVLSLFVLSKKLKTKTRKTLKQIAKNLSVYKNKPHKIILVYLGATLITLLFVTALLACSRAVGLQITFVQAFICYTVGVVVGAAALTPGGLGGVEAGLYGALITYNNESSTVFAAVILYRLVTYWIPIIPGILCFSILRSSKKI